MFSRILAFQLGVTGLLDLLMLGTYLTTVTNALTGKGLYLGSQFKGRVHCGKEVREPGV